MILDTTKVLASYLFSKQVNWAPRDGFSSMDAQAGAIKLAMAGIGGGADILHC